MKNASAICGISGLALNAGEPAYVQDKSILERSRRLNVVNPRPFMTHQTK